MESKSYLKNLQKNWEQLSDQNAMWAILSKGKNTYSWDEEEFFLRGKKECDKTLAIINKLKPDFAFDSFVDFGCGIGRLTQAFMGHFKQGYGIDISSTMISKALRLNRYGDKCEYLVNDSADLNIIEDDSVNMVYSRITLQHIRPHEAANYIKDFIRILNKDGLALFQIPANPPLYFKLLYRLLPVPIFTFLVKLKTGSKAVMEMHWIPKEEIEKIIKESTGKLILIIPDQAVKNGWESYMYCVTKSGLKNDF